MRIGIVCYPTIGGSGVVVTPVTYIFEEEPPAYTRMVSSLNSKA